MNQQNNRTNILSECYHKLDKRNKRIFRRKLSELCNIHGEKTLYLKLRPEYEPSPIEEIASKMIVDELVENNLL
jgi:hypothetical protein